MSVSLPRKHFRHFGSAADERDEISLRQACLLQTKFDGRDWARETHRDMLLFVVLNEIGQDIELIAFRGIGLSVHERFDASERGVVVRFSSELP